MLATLEKASRLLQDQLIKDAQMVPELGELLTGSSFYFSFPTLVEAISGASSVAYNLPPHRSWAPFFRPDGLEGFKSMPSGVFDEYDEGWLFFFVLSRAEWIKCSAVQPHCCMGILPEIQRAWITLNNRLLLWDYAEG